MRRREFIAGLGVVAWPLAAKAQRPAMPVVGYLGPTTAADADAPAFVQRLRELSWVEGHNIIIEYRWSQGRAELGTEFLTEFIRRRVDVIVTIGTPYHSWPSVRHRSFPLFSLWPAIRSAPGWLKAWRDPVATLPAFRHN
jgi:hypothetical protein